jgi:hypothetical protein
LATERRTDAPTDIEIQIQIQTYTGTHKKRIGKGGEKERKKKEKGLRIDKVRNISSFLSFLELDCIRV